MASNQCIIDDAYCTQMGTYFKRQGEQLDRMIADYITALENVRDTAIIKGDVHVVLDAYIDYAENMKEKLGVISNNAQAHVTKFLAKVDETDQYLF